MSAAAPQKVALVTGANKGIGFGIVQELSKHNDLHVLLGARNEERGKKAVADINRKNVSFLQLDQDDEKSIEAAAAHVKKQYGGLDILVNNAGIAFKGDRFDEEVARVTLHTNFFGLENVCKHFLALMRSNGRVVNISSSAGVRALQRCSKELQEQFIKPNLTINELHKLLQKFVADVKDGSYAQKGWPNMAYGISKTGVTQLTRILASDNKTPGLIISACCPGWVKTDMAGPNAALTVEQAAVTPVFLCFAPADSPSGKFWKNKQISPAI